MFQHISKCDFDKSQYFEKRKRGRNKKILLNQSIETREKKAKREKTSTLSINGTPLVIKKAAIYAPILIKAEFSIKESIVDTRCFTNA